jgi:flagellar M-ring protein FliF
MASQRPARSARRKKGDDKMSSILTNTSAMVALQTLKGINANLAKTQDEISTGKMVASAKDNAAYWRAKEGELARTLLALPQIRSARVHIARADPQPFRSPDRQTASVTITTASGTLAAGQAQAVRHLVASAVAGMTPEDVAVIDSVGGLIGGGEANDPGEMGESRAAELKRNVERLLAARVGPGNAVVEISVDVATERESISERRFDPENRVAIATDTEEKSGSSTDPGGQVTVASNLPEGDAAGGDAGQSSTSETRERVNFEVSETKRDILRAPGTVKRISVAVLVNDPTTPGADGQPAVTPRPQEELDVLRDLVASAVGFDEARGDTITLRSMAFQPVPELGTTAESGMIDGLDMMALIQMLVLAAVVLVLALFVLRPMLLARKIGGPAPDQAPALALPGLSTLSDPGGMSAGAGPRVVTGEIDMRDDIPTLPIISRDDPMTGLPEDPVARLRRLIDERQAESLEILRGWMEDREEKA